MELAVRITACQAADGSAGALNLTVVARAVELAAVGIVALHLTTAAGARVIAVGARWTDEVTTRAFALERTVPRGASAVGTAADGPTAAPNRGDEAQRK